MVFTQFTLHFNDPSLVVTVLNFLYVLFSAFRSLKLLYPTQTLNGGFYIWHYSQLSTSLSLNRL
jgi:hypothetical protein